MRYESASHTYEFEYICVSLCVCERRVWHKMVCRLWVRRLQDPNNLASNYQSRLGRVYNHRRGRTLPLTLTHTHWRQERERERKRISASEGERWRTKGTCWFRPKWEWQLNMEMEREWAKAVLFVINDRTVAFARASFCGQLQSKSTFWTMATHSNYFNWSENHDLFAWMLYLAAVCRPPPPPTS